MTLEAKPGALSGGSRYYPRGASDGFLRRAPAGPEIAEPSDADSAQTKVSARIRQGRSMPR